MKPRPQLPQDVKDHIRAVFADCNARVTTKLAHIPNLHETSLDHTFIEHFTHHCRPVLTQSEWMIRFDCHFIGGGRHWMRWEVADFGIVVVFRYRGQVWLSKVALLQSKRLFPKEFDGVETNPLDVELGFNFLFMNERRWTDLATPRSFRFDDSSRYRSLEIADEQYEAIEKYEDQHRIPVHYLLYNPLQIPYEMVFPVMSPPKQCECKVGARVVPSTAIRSMVKEHAIERPPSYGDMTQRIQAPFSELVNSGGWRLETYIVDELLACRDGLIDESAKYEHLSHIFSQKSAPIHAALVINLDMPSEPA